MSGSSGNQSLLTARDHLREGETDKARTTDLEARIITRSDQAPTLSLDKAEQSCGHT